MAVATTRAGVPSDDKRWRIVETRMRRLGHRPDALIEVLHSAQEAFGFLDTDTLGFVGASLGVPLSKVYGVATFYSFFTLEPKGEHACVVCTGTACYINGAGGTWPGSGAGSASSRAGPPRTGSCRCSPPAAWAPAAWPRR